MFRWLAVLCVRLYLAMLIGGEDRGQVRFGLMPQKADTQDAFMVVQGAASPVQARPAQTDAADLQVVAGSFAPEKPLMVIPTPDAAVPVALDAEGMPRAVQMVAALYRDDLALRGARALERAASLPLANPAESAN